MDETEISQFEGDEQEAAITEDEEPAIEEEIEEPELPADCTFRDITTDEFLLAAIDRLGFTRPTEVQRRAVPTALKGGDMLVQAQTGSGKTLAFVMPMLHALRESGRDKELSTTFALVVVPTRELALQCVEVINSLTSEIKPVCVIGGTDLAPQIRDLKSDGRIVIGTPGRLLDLIKQKALRLNQCRFFALDEVDEMLSIGFLEDVRSILSRLPDRRQGLFVSATITPRVEMLAHSFLTHPKSIFVQREGSAPAPIEHLYCEIGGDLMAKPAALCDFIETLRPRSAIIFCNTKSDTLLVEALLRRRGFDARRINSDLTQAQRNRVMKRIRKGDLQFLVATDIAARGLDIEQIDLVVNYAIHEQPETYIHRTGRTGRAGRSGKAISLIGPRDFGAFHFLTKVVDLKFTKIPIPTDEEVADARITHLYEMLRTKEIEIKQRDLTVAKQLLREMGGYNESPEELEAIIAKLCRYTVEHFISSEAASLEEELENAATPAPEGEEGRRERRGDDRRERRDDRRSDDRRGGERRGRDDRRDRGGRDRRDRNDSERGERRSRSEHHEEGRGERRERSDDQGEGRTEGAEQLERYSERESRQPRHQNGTPDVRLYLGQGSEHGMSPQVFTDIAKEFANIEPDALRNISIRGHYGFVDVQQKDADKLIGDLNGIEYNGHALPVELAYVPSPDPRNRGRGRRNDNDRDYRGSGGRDRDRGGRGRGDRDRGRRDDRRGGGRGRR